MKVTFGSEFKTKSSSDYSKFSLDTGEAARVCVIGDPTMKFVHTLNKVIVDQDGAPVMESRETKNGRIYEVPKSEFVGKFLCLGDEDTLFAKDIDPENCPACRASLESPAVDGPKRRYAVNILHYSTNGGKFTLKNPYQVSCKPWEFSQNRFSSLVDIAEEQGDLKTVDLLVKCISSQFQNLEITTGKSGAPAWATSEDTKKLTSEVKNSDSLDDSELTTLMGREVTAVELQSFVNDIVAQYEVVLNPGAASKASSDEEAIDDSDFSAILGGGNADTADTATADEDSDEESEDDNTGIEDISALLSSLK